MTQWALLSGIVGNLAAYEAVVADLKRPSHQVSHLFILGDVVGPTPDCEALLQRLQTPRPGEITPQLCLGWWEEQALILHGLGPTGDPEALRRDQGSPAVERLWHAVSRSAIQWIRSWDFGIQELDCLLIHGSTVAIDEALTPATPLLQLLDRVTRAEVNTLFCGRSGHAFQVAVTGGAVAEEVITLGGSRGWQPKSVAPKQVVGVGSVGKTPGLATYTLYDPGSGHLRFRRLSYRLPGGRHGFS